MKLKNSLQLSSVLFLTFTLPAMAASQNWDGGSLVNGNWSDVGNWNAAVPGSTSVTTNTDVATFNAAIVNTWGDAVGNPVVIDSATQNIGGLSFTLASGSYFVGSTGGNALKLTSAGTIQILAGLTATNAVETINAPLAIQLAAGTYTFANNSANGAGVGAGTLNFGGLINGAVAGATALTLSGSNTNANTISGVIANGTATNLAIVKSGAGKWVLNNANTYTGSRTVSAGTLVLEGNNSGAGTTIVGAGITTPAATLQLSGANGALSVVNATAIELRNTGSLVLDNTDAAGGNNDDRIVNGQGILLNGGNLILKGADATLPATNTSETIGALTVGSSTVAGGFLNHNSLLAVRFGATNTATLTAASLTRPVTSVPTVLVNGTNLGMDSASAASVGRVLLTAAPALTGTTVAAATGIDAAVKNTKIVPFLVGEAIATTGGLGTATGTPNTFVTYHATTGLRPLNPADEFTHNAITAGNNTYITTPIATSGSAAINSLVINGADLTITDGDTLTTSSGAILIASNNTIKPSSSTGTLAFGGTEAQITINSGVTARITAPITGTGVVTFSGPGTLQVTGTTTYSSLAGNAALDLAAGSTLIAGGGNATTIFSGALSGSGTLTKTGTGTLSLGTNSNAGNGINDHFLFSGDINVNAGNVTAQYASEINTKSKLTISTGGTLQLNGNMSVFSLFGTGGTMTATPPSGGATLTVNYTGTDPAAGFTGTLTSTANNYGNAIQNAGSGDLTFGTLLNGARVTSVGTGKMTAVAIAGGGEGARVTTPFARVVLTGNTGIVNGGAGVTQLSGGTLTLAPSGSGANVLVTGQGLAGTFRVRISGGGTLQLDKGSNASMEYRVGLSTNTNTDFLQFISTGSGPGSLILDPVAGATTLGSATGSKFTVLNSTSGKVLSNGLVPIAMVVIDNDGTKKGDFVTYNGTGVAGDAGYQQATYTLNDTFAGSTNVSVVKNTSAQTISADTSAFALRNDNTISIDVTKTLTLGAPTSTVNANANATQSPNSGLILNGGTISGSGTLAFGATAAVIYTSASGGTIGAKMTGSGGTNAGYGAYSGNLPASVIKFGAGTLTLSGSNAYTGATVINAGAVDVGTITGTALSGSTSVLTFGGGVIQGNGTFVRSLGTGTNQVTWNGVNHTYSNMSGGFAARGGDLTVAIGGIATPTTLIWGMEASNNNSVAGWVASEFITEVGNVGQPAGQTGVLMFGSNTSDSQVDFRNAINLGTLSANVATSANASPNYYRIINVAQGTGADSAKISGNISSTVVHGLIKDGAGKLVLAGTNTYTGDTVVAHGSLELSGTHAATPNITVNPGATYALTNTGAGLGFAITTAASSSINGAGAATLDGTFTLNTAAVTATTGAWTLVNTSTLSETFGTNFAVAGFTQKSDGVTWSVTEEGTRLWTFSETTGVLTLAVAPTNTYDSWIDGYFTGETDPAIIGAAADPDNDGITNAVEYVIGDVPNQAKVENLPAGTLVTADLGDGSINYLKFAYRRTAASVDAGVTASVEYDADLVGPWTTAVNDVAGVKIIETANGGLPGTDVAVYIPRGVNTKLFGRLVAEVPAP